LNVSNEKLLLQLMHRCKRKMFMELDFEVSLLLFKMMKFLKLIASEKEKQN